VLASATRIYTDSLTILAFIIADLLLIRGRTDQICIKANTVFADLLRVASTILRAIRAIFTGIEIAGLVAAAGHLDRLRGMNTSTIHTDILFGALAIIGAGITIFAAFRLANVIAADRRN
jgi:hypothetical protein